MSLKRSDKATCSICGERFEKGNGRHRCNQRTLDRIDAMHAAATLEPGLDRQEPESQRLADGLAMLEEK